MRPLCLSLDYKQLARMNSGAVQGTSTAYGWTIQAPTLEMPHLERNFGTSWWASWILEISFMSPKRSERKFWSEEGENRVSQLVQEDTHSGITRWYRSWPWRSLCESQLTWFLAGGYATTNLSPRKWINNIDSKLSIHSIIIFRMCIKKTGVD